MVDVVGLPGCHGADASSVRVRALSVGQRIQTLAGGRTPEARSPKAPARGRRSTAPVGSQRNLRAVQELSRAICSGYESRTPASVPATGLNAGCPGRAE